MKLTEYEKDKIYNDRITLIQDLGLFGIPILLIIALFNLFRSICFYKKRR